MQLLRKPRLQGSEKMTLQFSCIVLLIFSQDAARAVTFNNVISLGDSLLDDPEGERSPVSAEHIAERLGVPLTRFAMSGSTSDDLIADQQHIRAAEQFGEGDLAVLWIGGNDFFESTLGVPFGFFGFIDDLESNVDTALRTLREDNIEVVVFNLPDLSNIPLTDAISNFREATEIWNARLDNLAEEHGATVVDIFSLFDDLANNPSDFALLGNTPILESAPLFFGECPLCVFADPVHPSAYAQGFIANEAIDVINEVYDPNGNMPLESLSRVEIALLAGLQPGDFDNNQVVDAADLSLWESSFGSTGADADSDGDTDGLDFLFWQQQATSGSANLSLATAVPEPAAISLALLSLAVSLAICRSKG